MKGLSGFCLLVSFVVRKWKSPLTLGMPKLKKERVRRHAAAVGSKDKEADEVWAAPPTFQTASSSVTDAVEEVGDAATAAAAAAWVHHFLFSQFTFASLENSSYSL
jgi:hypothetical protein